MAFELFYTSAVQGMKRGSGGFCTVGASDGMARGLWERLESLSGYRHVGAAGGGGNPVSFGHCVVEVGGMKYHVLSRVGDAGVDHTQRPNAFAHHVVVGAQAQMARGGPAWMLKQAGVMAEAWEGRVGTIEARTLPQGGGNEGGVCRLWKEATGDAGWGGRLADVFAVNGAAAVCVVFGPGMDMLGLLAESIALLPAELRWGVTFNTHFTTMPTSAQCAWRCCLAGTPAAQSGMRYAASGLLVDLTKPMGAAPAGAYVEYARTGRGKPAMAQPAIKMAVGIAGVKAPAAATETGELPAAEDVALPPMEEAIAEEPAAEVAAPARPRRRKKVEVGMLEEITGRAADRAATQRRRRALWMMGGALAAIAAGMGLVWWAAAGRHPDDAALDTDGVPATQIAQASRPAPPRPEPDYRINPEVPRPDVVPSAKRVTLKGDMEAPAAGGGIHDPAQLWPLRPAQLGAVPVRSISVNLLGGSPYAANGVAGVMSADDGGQRTALIHWRDKDSPPDTAWTAATVTFSDEGLQVEWKAGFLLTHAEAVPTVYWRLRGGTILGVARGSPTAGESPLVALMSFDRWIGKAVDFASESVKTGVPVALPEDSSVMATGLPEGWEQAASQTGGAATQPGLSAGQVIQIRKPGEDATATAAFELLFRAGFTEVVSTFTARQADAEAGLKETQDELAALDASAAGEKKERLLAQAARYKQAVAGYNELQKFDVALLVSGVRVGTLPFVRGGAATAPAQPASQPGQ